MTRLRLRFSKLGKVRFTSHRDVARIWERALRRGGVAVAYTEGFSPRPKLSFGLALSTGYESYGEYLDVALGDDATGPDEVAAKVASGLPQGIEVQAAVVLPPREDSLQQAVTRCTWHVDVGGVAPAGAADILAAALARAELPVTRVRKGESLVDDVRPAIISARVLGEVPSPAGSATRVEAELATQPRGLRPVEFVAAIAATEPAWSPAPDDTPGHARGGGTGTAGARLVRATRIHQWTQAGGARREVIPLPPAATLPPHAEARAS